MVHFLFISSLHFNTHELYFHAPLKSCPIQLACRDNKKTREAAQPETQYFSRNGHEAIGRVTEISEFEAREGQEACIFSITSTLSLSPIILLTYGVPGFTFLRTKRLEREGVHLYVALASVEFKKTWSCTNQLPLVLMLCAE
jgi:hypothetical protein